MSLDNHWEIIRFRSQGHLGTFEDALLIFLMNEVLRIC